MKLIQSFREKDYAMFIDLVDAKAALSIDKDTGNILFHEGLGDGRYDGMAAHAESFKKFQTSSFGTKGDTAKLSICFAGQTHLLGFTKNIKEAMAWTDKATALLRSKQAVEKKRDGKMLKTPKINFATRALAKSA